MSELERTGSGHYCALFLTEYPLGPFETYVGASAEGHDI